MFTRRDAALTPGDWILNFSLRALSACDRLDNMAIDVQPKAMGQHA